MFPILQTTLDVIWNTYLTKYDKIDPIITTPRCRYGRCDPTQETCCIRTWQLSPVQDERAYFKHLGEAQRYSYLEAQMTDQLEALCIEFLKKDM